MPEIVKTIDDEIKKLEKLKMDMLKGNTKGGKSMKIAISAKGKGLDSQVDMRFGRCPNYVIVELEGNKIKSSEDIENTATAQMGGAGITASQIVADKGVKSIITGNIGPRAFQIFSQLGIEMYQGSGTVKEVIEKYIKGQLKKMAQATGPMHAGIGP